MLKKLAKKLPTAVVVALFWLFVWYMAAKAIGKELLLPSPGAVLHRLFELASEKEFYIITAFSVVRVLSGIFTAVVFGTLLAVLTHISRIANALASPILTVVKATPVASFIILALVWIDRSSLPIFIAFLMVMPVVCTNVKTGLGEIDTALLSMAQIYKVGLKGKLLGIYIPSVMPYFTSAAKTSLGLAWKAGIAAEVLAVPKNSIGKELFNSKAYFETADLFAWTVLVIILSLAIELVFETLIMRLMKKRRGKDA